MMSRDPVHGKRGSRQLTAPLIVALEPRWMFDGAAVVDALHASADSASNHASSAAEGEAASSGHSSLPNAP
uniref:hypothetical protein n=1 Tax=Candidatus Magnetaquicoccus inordinatus TaxID=2496818 RepID=UPI00102CC355